LSALFTIYRSSAGSGKTRTLAKEYLKLALRFRAGYFKHILAVTFTNKSTQEMKERILSYLNKFSHGWENDLATELQVELNLDPSTFRLYSEEVRSEILHHYSLFSISTIDAFFQKVIRAFTREAGLAGDYRLELQHEPVMEEVIDNLIDELGSNPELTRWVIDFALKELEETRAWDIRKSLLEFSSLIFKDEFREIEEEFVRKISAKNYFHNLKKELEQRRGSFIKTIKSKAAEGVKLIQDHQYRYDDFKYAGGGAYSFLVKLSNIEAVSDFNEKEKGKRPEGDYQQSKNWPAADSPHRAQLQKLAEEKLIPLLNEILDYREQHFKVAYSAEVALNNFYEYGLIADISRKLKEYKDENGILLLSDTPHFLQGIISHSDTPFIYEKVGSFYKNFLIDEFQDTSRMQWKNFLPLVTNALDQGYPSLVVGDVKQAVYRWRGGDLNLLQQEVEEHIGTHRTGKKGLQQNFRSAPEIIAFNNELFRVAAVRVSLETNYPVTMEAYQQAEQQAYRGEKGFVEISFLPESKEVKWKNTALRRVPKLLEQLQQNQVALKDIAILVRKNEEGQEVANQLIQYKNSDEALPGCRYDVVSNDSLMLEGAATVNLLVSAMKYLLNGSDDIARAQFAYEYARLKNKRESLSELFLGNQALFESSLPEAFSRRKTFLRKLPLYELTESLVEIFSLGDQVGEFSYLQSFQDQVMDFASRERNDLGAFILWWEENKSKKYIKVPGAVNAAQIVTLHKAKGLQFKYVIIPFCSWELDNFRQTIWVKSDVPPFDQAGHLPVKYENALKETLFDSYHHEEQARTYLDNLNLLYVAFTRAEQGLIVMAPDEKAGKMYSSTVSRILHEAIENSEQLNTGWDASRQVWQSGDWNMSPSEPEESQALSIHPFSSSSWRSKLVIKQTSKGFFRDADAEKNVRMKYGIHLHTILSRIKYKSESEASVQSILMEGMMTEEEMPVIQTLLDELFAHPQVAQWFAPPWQVRTEVPVLLPGEGDYRMDRLMTYEKKAIVVDFKTGVPDKQDQKQVASYMETLRKMNFHPVEGYLLYLPTFTVVPVPPGKVIRPKGKDEQQLGLDF
jgi:ATP-dependent helicase/nuclease subunit A